MKMKNVKNYFVGLYNAARTNARRFAAYTKEVASDVYGSRGRDGEGNIQNSWSDIVSQFFGAPNNVKRAGEGSTGAFKNLVGWQGYKSPWLRAANGLASVIILPANLLLAIPRLILNVAKLATEVLTTFGVDGFKMLSNQLANGPGKRVALPALFDLVADLFRLARFIGRAITSPVANMNDQTGFAKGLSAALSSVAWLVVGANYAFTKMRDAGLRSLRARDDKSYASIPAGQDVPGAGGQVQGDNLLAPGTWQVVGGALGAPSATEPQVAVQEEKGEQTAASELTGSQKQEKEESFGATNNPALSTTLFGASKDADRVHLPGQGTAPEEGSALISSF